MEITESNTIEEAARFLKTRSRVAITTHTGVDGDAVGSSAALFYLVRHLGAEATLCHSEELPEYLGWLLPEAPSPEFPGGCDLLVVDTSRPDRVGVPHDSAEFNLDHHEDNPLYGAEMNLVDSKAAASAELVARLYDEMGVPLEGPAAEAIYAGLLTDTGGFRFRNISPRVHRLVARLLEGGVMPAEIDRRLSQSYTVAQLNIVGISMANAERYGEALVSVVDDSDYERAGATELDSKEAIDHLRSVAGIEVVAHLRQVPEGTKGSLRSESVDVGAVARSFGGGGHRLAAGFTFNLPPKEAREKLLEALSEVVRVEE